MKRSFSGMTAQQAPSPRTIRQALLSLPGTVQTAFRKPHCIRLMNAFASTAISSSDTMLEEIDPNRLARSQRIARPTTVLFDRLRLKGIGFCGASVTEAMAQRSTSAIRALYQFMNRL